VTRLPLRRLPRRLEQVSTEFLKDTDEGYAGAVFGLPDNVFREKGQTMDRVFRIMVVEDSETQAFKLRCLLEAQGWQVSTAGAAEAALAAIGDPLPDFLLVDYNLPGMRGDEFCRRIRMNLITRGIPILVMTSTAPSMAEIQSLDSGADDYVSKSDGEEILLLRIRVLLRRSPAQPAILTSRGSNFQPSRILAIDDSPTYLTFVAVELRNQGYEVETAASGMEGLNRLVDGGFDCVLVDLIMSGMDGIEVCRRIAAMSKSATNDAAVIILTGSDDHVDLNRSLESGADDFIRKSKDLAVLLARIQALVRRRYFREESGRIFEVLSARTLDALNAHVALEKAEIEGKHDPREASGKPGVAIDEPLALVVSNLSIVESRLESLCAEMETHLAGDSLWKLRDTRARLKDMRHGLDRVKQLALDLPASSVLGADRGARTLRAAFTIV